MMDVVMNWNQPSAIITCSPVCLSSYSQQSSLLCCYPWKGSSGHFIPQDACYL